MGKPPFNSAKATQKYNVHILICQPGRCPKCSHSGKFPGTILTGMQSINNLPAARLGDMGEHDCPHGKQTFTIVEGDPTVIIEGSPASRVGDKVICNTCGGPGEIVLGSSDTYTEG